MAETNGLLNRRAGINLHRGFESRPLRFVPVPLPLKQNADFTYNHSTTFFGADP